LNIKKNTTSRLKLFFNACIFIWLSACYTPFLYAQNANAQAQDKDVQGEKMNHNQKLEFPPKALLVMLHTEKNRIKYFKDKGQTALANLVLKDAEHLANITINDFSSHFDFCPVFFFLDTALDAIKNQQFSGNLINSDGSLVASSIINPGDTNYFIVYYGNPENNKTSLWAGNDAEYRYGSGNVTGKGLIFMNHHFVQKDFYAVIVNFRPYLYKLIDPNYEYYSKKFDMEYRPLAARYNKELHAKYSH